MQFPFMDLRGVATVRRTQSPGGNPVGVRLLLNKKGTAVSSSLMDLRGVEPLSENQFLVLLLS